MKHIGLLFVLCLAAFSGQARADQIIPATGKQIADRVEADLKACGLQLLDPHTPGMIWQRNDAKYAVVSANGQLLAYYMELWGPSSQWYWMAPNGGSRHIISFDNDSLSVQTPFQGVVASTNRFFTPAGVGFNFYCRRIIPGRVNAEQFKMCVQRDFVNVLTNQLCRFGSKTN